MSENTTTTTVTLTTDDATAMALVATIRAEVNSGPKYIAYVEAHTVTRQNVKHHAAALAALVYPNDAPVQTKDGVRTRYGNAVQAAGNGLRRALGKEGKVVEPGVIRISLSGEGGGTVTLREGDAGYGIALGLIAGNDVTTGKGVSLLTLDTDAA